MYERYIRALGGAFEGYVDVLTAKSKSDDEIAVLCGCRWSYLFHGLTFFEWSEMVTMYRTNPQYVRDVSASGRLFPKKMKQGS